MSFPIVSVNLSSKGSDSSLLGILPCADEAMHAEDVHDLVLKHRGLVVGEPKVGERGLDVRLKVVFGFFRLVVVPFIQWHAAWRSKVAT